MLVNRSVRKFVALVLAGTAVAGVVEAGSEAVGVRRVAATTSNQGDPHSVPPILRQASPVGAGGDQVGRGVGGPGVL